MVVKIVAVAVVALALELIGAVPVRAQAGNPANPADAINNPHPAMPWAPGRRVDYGQAIRYIEVPAQYLVIMVPVRLPDGLQYIDLTLGTGTVAVKGAKLSMQYTGWLLEGRKFDSSCDRNQPFSFTLQSAGNDGIFNTPDDVLVTYP